MWCFAGVAWWSYFIFVNSYYFSIESVYVGGNSHRDLFKVLCIKEHKRIQNQNVDGGDLGEVESLFISHLMN